MDTDPYKIMVNDILMDESYYEKLRNDPQKDTRSKYEKLIKKYSNCLTKNKLTTLHILKRKKVNFKDYLKFTRASKFLKNVNVQIHPML